LISQNIFYTILVLESEGSKITSGEKYMENLTSLKTVFYILDLIPE